MTNRAKYWQRMVTAWEAGGLSQAEFCRRRGLKAVTFARWKRQLVGNFGRGGRGGRGGDARRKASPGQQRPAFVEVAMPDGATDGRSAKGFEKGTLQSDGYCRVPYCVAAAPRGGRRIAGMFERSHATQ